MAGDLRGMIPNALVSAARLATNIKQNLLGIFANILLSSVAWCSSRRSASFPSLRSRGDGERLRVLTNVP